MAHRLQLAVAAAITAIVAAVSAPAQAVPVLVLGDGDAQDQVRTALEAAGHQVTVVDLYYEWDGLTPDVDQFGFVVLLDGYDFAYELQPAAASALVSFVAGGCGLLMTEWMAYDVSTGNKTGAIVDLVPVTGSALLDLDGSSWSVLAAHPLTAGLPASWSDAASATLVSLEIGSTGLISGDGGNPMLSYSTANGGPVVHVNHDMTYSTITMHENALRIIVNAVGWGACAVSTDVIFADDFEDGTMAAWTANP